MTPGAIFRALHERDGAFVMPNPCKLEGGGVKRISIGGALAVASYTALWRGAPEILYQGSFTYARDVPADMNLDELFGSQ